MDLKRKLEMFEQSVLSIARHDDEDAAVRHAALDAAAKVIAAEKAAMDERTATRARQLVDGQDAAD